MKKTEWFPADVKPVRIGLYETKGYLLTNMRLWTGLEWITPHGRVECVIQEREWRGLAEKPE